MERCGVVAEILEKHPFLLVKGDLTGNANSDYAIKFNASNLEP